MDRHHDRRLGHRALAEVRDIERCDVGVLLPQVDAVLVAPEGLALVAARDRERRGQREPRVLPPERTGADPAEHVGREHGAPGIDHRLFRRDVCARGRAQVRERHDHLVQRFGRRPDVFERADGDAVSRVVGGRWHDEHLLRNAWRRILA